MLTLENSPGLAEILMNEQFEGTTGEQFVKWAQDALEQGHDSPSLLKLAIEEPPFFTPDLRRLFASATSEIQIQQVAFEQARVFHAQTIAKQLNSVAASPLEIAERLARIFPPHSSSAPFDIWWQLEEAFECDYCLRGLELRGKVLDQAIFEELDNLLRFNWRAA